MVTRGTAVLAALRAALLASLRSGKRISWAACLRVRFCLESRAAGGEMNDAVVPARFGLLGPLRVWRGETAVDLGPLQQRVVLAVLALQAGRPVSREQVINAVWGEA